MKPINNFLIFIFLILTFSSCGDDFLSLSSKDTVTESAFFITQEDAYSALAGVYATLQNEATFTNVRNAADIEWAITGDLYEMDRSANRIELHSLRFPASNTILRDIYQNSYLGISRANVVVDKISKSPISQETKDQIIGQALFIRGLYYYNLVHFFGGVPLITTPLSASDDLQLPRNSADEVWDQVEKDMIDASSLLPIKWDNDIDKGRVTKTSAWGFLVKAFLWREKWDDAIIYSEKIISSGQHSLIETGFRDIFREENENNAEMVFSTQFSTLQGEQNNLVARTAPRGAPSKYTGPAAWSNFVPNRHWVNAMEKNTDNTIKDDRYSVILGPTEIHPENGYQLPAVPPAGMTKTGYIVTKYWFMPPIQNSGINAPILRYSEVLLNYAEALNEKGKSEDAMRLVNQVRIRAKLEPKSANLSKELVLDAIFEERRFEFIWEPTGGFNDLNRRGRFIEFIKKNRPDFQELGIDAKPWLHTKPILFPIPTEAWTKNRALVQNPHYTF